MDVLWLPPEFRGPPAAVHFINQFRTYEICRGRVLDEKFPNCTSETIKRLTVSKITKNFVARNDLVLLQFLMYNSGNHCLKNGILQKFILVFNLDFYEI
jgi:hypothetical protein